MSQRIQWSPMVVPNGGIDETRSPLKIEPNKWASASDVEPLADGVRLRRGSSASNGTSLKDVAVSHTSGTNNREFASTVSEYISQGFQVAANIASFGTVSVRLKILTGTPTGTVQVAIFNNSAGEPGAALTNLNFGDFSSIAASALTSRYAWYRFTASSATTLSTATQYHLVVRHAAAGLTGTDNIGIEENTATGSYASGSVYYDTNATTPWTNVAGADLNFRIYDATSSPVRMIADYKLDDGSTTRHLVLHQQEVYKNVGGTMTAVSVGHREGFTDDANELPAWCVGQNRVFITNKVELPQKFYVLSGTEYWENEGIATPTATPTLGVGAGNALPDGVYYVDYYYWNNDIGQPSDRRYAGANTLVSASLATQHLTISGLPSAVARDGDRATHIRIELKEVGSTLFRLVKTITLGTTSTTIGASDLPTTVEAEYSHAVPPLYRACVVAENRKFVLNVTSAPWRLMWSGVIGTTPYYESYKSTNFRDFGKGDGDYGTALFFMRPRTLIVGMKNSVWAMDARTPATSDRMKIADGIGVAGVRAGIVVGNTFFFVSDGEKSRGMFRWDAGSSEVRPVFGIDDTFKGLSQTRLKYASCGHLAPGDNRFQWWTLCSAAAASTHNRLLIYDYVLDAWAIYTKAAGLHGAVIGEVESLSASSTSMYLGGTAGVEYVQDTGSTDAGTAISGTLKLGANDFGIAGENKRMRFAEYVMARQTSGGITLSVARDYGQLPAMTAQFDHSGLSGAVYGTSLYGASTYTAGGNEEVNRRVAVRGVGRIFQPEFYGTTVWHLKAVSFGLQMSERNPDG